jgi:hypothetical protein
MGLWSQAQKWIEISVLSIIVDIIFIIDIVNII